jgi:hypothetical protein
MKQRQGHWVDQKKIDELKEIRAGIYQADDPDVVTKKDKAESIVVWVFGCVVIPIGLIAWASFIVGMFL